MAQRPTNCGVGPAFEVIGGKWKAVILWELHEGPKRFGELRRLIAGISEKMLIQQLRELEFDSLVDRHVFHEVPPKVEYSLTALGKALNKAMGPLADWGEKYQRTQAQRASTPAKKKA